MWEIVAGAALFILVVLAVWLLRGQVRRKGRERFYWSMAENCWQQAASSHHKGDSKGATHCTYDAHMAECLARKARAKGWWQS